MCKGEIRRVNDKELAQLLFALNSDQRCSCNDKILLCTRATHWDFALCPKYLQFTFPNESLQIKSTDRFLHFNKTYIYLISLFRFHLFR